VFAVWVAVGGISFSNFRSPPKLLDPNQILCDLSRQIGFVFGANAVCGLYKGCLGLSENGRAGARKTRDQHVREHIKNL